ncbi:MAG: hypothetical protein HRU40_01325 [Saprospiraceae bacterium]|nr:hypothetical protein [Saprospiraceae bacterium]
MKKFVLFYCILISLSAHYVSANAQISSCLPNYRYGPQTYTFLSPQLVHSDLASAPFLLPFEQLYKKKGTQASQQIQTNLQEWHLRFCEIPDINDMGRTIYQSSVRELQGLQSAIRNKNIPLPIPLQGNTFAQYLKRNRCEETVKYLIFAKRCEPYVTLNDPWADRKKYAPDMLNLIDQGLREFRRTDSHYYRLRYAYQIIRLAHYTQQFQRVLDLYDFLMPKTDNDPSIIEDWIMAHRAGALRSLGQEVEAAYLFSRVFENCPGKREAAYHSFRIKTDAQWEALLQRCQGPEEQATLYALQAKAPNARVIDELQEIYQLDPDNHHLEVLLLKLMARLEANFLGTSFNAYRRENKRYHNVPSRNAEQDLIRSLDFVRFVVKRGRIPNAPLWQLAEGYLALLSGDFYAAQTSFNGLSGLKKGSIIQQQLDICKLVMEILKMDTINDAVENRLAEIMFDNNLYRRHPDLPSLIQDKLTQLYQTNNKEGKLFLHQYSLQELRVNPKLSVIDSILVLTGKSKLNRLERALLREEASLNMRNDMLNLKGMLFLSQGDQIPAIEALKRIDNVAKNDYARFNPFEERINDCINCARQDSFRRYNREQLINRFQELEYEALANQEMGARNFYLIGLALYNMTYFGYAWEGMDQFRSGASIRKRPLGSDPQVRPHPNFPNGNREAFDCKPALEYFKTTLRLTNNPELAARAVFMAAKCEQNEYFAYGGDRTYTYFNLLSSEYTQTQFYQQAIEECAYLEFFVNQ